jgi:hypothetical protein
MQMPFLIFVAAGLVLMLTDGWFDQQHTVGLVMTIVGAVVVLLNLLVIAGAGALAWFTTRRF